MGSAAVSVGLAKRAFTFYLTSRKLGSADLLSTMRGALMRGYDSSKLSNHEFCEVMHCCRRRKLE